MVFALTTCAFGYLALVRWNAAAAPDAAAGKAEESPSAASAPKPAAQSAPGAIVLEAKGYIIPARQILVSPKVAGMVVTLPIVEGQRVRKGDILAQLESTDYQADVDRAAAMLEQARQQWIELDKGFRKQEVEQAQAELAEAQTQLQQYEADFGRQSQLWKDHVISDEQYEQAHTQYQAMERRVARLRFALELMQLGAREERKAAAKAAVEQAQAELAKARWRLENCTIRAPVSGTILKKNAEEGNVVNPIAFNGSFSLCEMADLSDLEVELTIQERDIARVSKDQACRIRAEAFPERVYRGWVSRLMPIADRAKGAIPVRVKIVVPTEEEGVYLKPEMGAIVSFLNEKFVPPPARR